MKSTQQSNVKGRKAISALLLSPKSIFGSFRFNSLRLRALDPIALNAPRMPLESFTPLAAIGYGIFAVLLISLRNISIPFSLDRVITVILVRSTTLYKHSLTLTPNPCLALSNVKFIRLYQKDFSKKSLTD